MQACGNTSSSLRFNSGFDWVPRRLQLLKRSQAFTALVSKWCWQVLLGKIKSQFAVSPAHFCEAQRNAFCDYSPNMAHFLCGLERLKCFVNVRYLYCFASNQKTLSKTSTLSPSGKISADAHAYDVINTVACREGANGAPAPGIQGGRASKEWIYKN